MKISKGWPAKQARILDAKLADIENNRDGILGNEDKKAGSPVEGFFHENPLGLAASVKTELSPTQIEAKIGRFVRMAEDKWGAPTLDPSVRSQMRNGDIYAAQKALWLARVGLSPAELTDHFTTARGSVNGRHIEERKIHMTILRPQSEEPKGKVVLAMPGYGETGRNFDDQALLLAKKGFTVVTMDHQWAGQSDGEPGGIDSGYGIARDSAAAMAFAAEVAGEGEVLVLATSMGAGPGAFMAATLGDNGLIDLADAEVPRGLKMVLQAPFFGATNNTTNSLLAMLGKVPVLNRMQVPATGLPVLTRDPVAAHLGAQVQVVEDIHSQSKAFVAAQDDLDRFMDDVLAGRMAPKGEVVIIGARHDSLADPEKWMALESALGDQLDLRLHEGKDHVMAQNKVSQHLAINALVDFE